MSKTRQNQSAKSKPSVGNIGKAISQLQLQMQNAANVNGTWIKERAQEVKKLLQTLLDKAETIPNRYELLDKLTQIRTTLMEMNKKRKNKDLKSAKKRSFSKSISSSKVSKVSKKSQKSQKRGKALTQNTPKFKKKPFSSKLGSFQKEFSEKRPASVSRSRSVSQASSKKRKHSADIADSSYVVKRRSRKTREVSHSPGSSIRKRTLSKTSKVSRGSSKKKSKKLLKRDSSARKKRTFSPDDSSSISLSSDLKEAVNLRMNHRTNPQMKVKYQALVEGEKKSNDIDAGQLSREENLLLTTKLESITKEKLLREYRILFYRSKEVRKLLAEYYEQNLQLNDLIEAQRNEIEQSKDIIRRMKKEIKTQSKEIGSIHNEYNNQIDQLQRTLQYNNVPVSDFEHLKADNERILIENTMLKEDLKLLQQRFQDTEYQSRRQDQYQESSQRIQREVDQLKEQFEKVREENLRLKLQLDKEQLSNRELVQQINQKRVEVDGSVEQKHYEVTSLKSQVQAANQKIQKLESQLSQQKYQLIAEQEQNFSTKEKVVRLEEELRISSLRVENREKELNDFRSKELILKKKLLELESKVECSQNEQFQTQVQSKSSFEMTNQVLNKELQAERQFLQKTQDQLLNLQKEYDQLSRNHKSLELELQYEQNQVAQLKQRNQGLGSEYDAVISRLQKQIEDLEGQRQKEFSSNEHQSKQLETQCFQAQQRVGELEMELRMMVKGESELKAQLSETKLQVEKSLSRLDQANAKLSELQQRMKGLESDNEELERQNKRLKIENSQLNKELDQVDRVKENYKNKYLNNRYESKKLISQLSEKENLLKQTYSSELEKVKSEKEHLERLKQEEEQQRNQKDKKLKVINDLQQMIKGHKKAFEK